MRDRCWECVTGSTDHRDLATVVLAPYLGFP